MKRLVISCENVSKNISLIRSKIGDAEIYAVLKSNAYGHGLCQMAAELVKNGVSRFAVTEPDDALTLRNEGFVDEEILIIRSSALEDDCKKILDATATASIGSTADAVMLNNLAAERDLRCEAHIKIDTGLGRYGFMPSEINDIISVFRLPNINITGMYSHFASSTDKNSCDRQITLFKNVIEKIRAAGIEPGILHIDSSDSVFSGRTDFFVAVRVGSAIYGTKPNLHKYGDLPIARLESDIAEIRWLPKGQSIGYSRAFVTRKPMKIAVVPLGYGDGYSVSKKDDIFTLRSKLGRAFRASLAVFKREGIYLTVNGKKAKSLGHVGMNHMVLDVTDIECSIGDTVVFNNASPLYVIPSIKRAYI